MSEKKITDKFILILNREPYEEALEYEGLSDDIKDKIKKLLERQNPLCSEQDAKDFEVIDEAIKEYLDEKWISDI